MPSTFTSNTGIEKIADGEQSGLWGQTTNLNFDIVDRALNGSVAISLSGTTHTLTTSSGLLSDGQFAVLVFAGSPSGTNTVTIAPNTAQKLYVVRNTTAQTVVLSQGSGANATVLSGKSAIVYSDGAGAGAAVVDVTALFDVVFPTATQTLTNKTIAFDDNALTGVAGTTAVQTLTNKTLTNNTIAFDDNTLTGVAGTTAIQTLTNKTLTNNTIAFDDNTLTGVAGTTAAQTLTNKTLTNNTIAFDDNTLTGVAGTTAIQTLTNKTIAFDDNTLTGVAGTTAAQTLTNKTLTNNTIAFDDNTLTDVAGTTATQTLTNKTLTAPEFTGAIYANGSYRGNVVAVPALDIDVSTGNYFTKSISANSTFTFSNTPASRAYAFTLRVAITGDIAITWPAAVEFPGDEAPTLTAGKTHLFMFATDNGGTTWRGAALADYEA